MLDQRLKILIVSVAILLIGSVAKAESFPADIVDFAPESNWYGWIIRNNNETGEGKHS